MPSELKRSFFRALDLSLPFAIAATVGFYAVILQPTMHDTILHRYTTEHPVEYVIVFMFIWGIIDIAFKTLSFPRETLALREKWLTPRTGREPVAHAAQLLAAVKTRSNWLAESRIGQRIAKALEHVVENGAGDEYREYLNYLSDKAHDDTHAKYTLIRFVIMVSPILGFLGTVVHFGTALSGISVDQLANHLPKVVSEMGQAFNTTTVALATSMTMMFGLFLCEKFEQGIDKFIDRFAEHELLNRFEAKHSSLNPFLNAIQTANEDALKLIGTNLDRQVQVFSESLESLFQQFAERREEDAAAWSQALDALQLRHEEQEIEGENRVSQLIALQRAQQTEHLGHLQKFLEDVSHLRGDVKEVGRALQALNQGEGKLLELQQTLTNNLQVLHETQQIDEALHGLTAAIHLLTTRYRPNGSDSLAA